MILDREIRTFFKSNDDVFSISTAYFLPFFRVKKPKIKVEKTEITHKIQPTVEFLNIPTPTNPVMNGREGREDSAIILSQSSLDIFSFLYSERVPLTDAVYPPRSPKT